MDSWLKNQAAPDFKELDMISEKELGLCRKYKDFIDVSAKKHDWKPWIIAGIASRESRFGLALSSNMTGDSGHGRGIMQIDDRSFGPWLRSHNWKDPAVNIEMGVQVLSDKFNYLSDHIDLDGDDLEKAAIAAYNCGEGNVTKVVNMGLGVDSRTTGHDYSADVLRRAEQFKKIWED